MILLSEAERELITDLADAYVCFLEEAKKGVGVMDNASVNKWAQILLSVQIKTGINLCDPDKLKSRINITKQLLVIEGLNAEQY